MTEKNGNTKDAGKAWGGRFQAPTDARVEAFTASIDVDRRLYEYDIAGSIVHCRGLRDAGIVTGAECDAVIGGLREIREEIDRGNFVFTDSLEDIHMHVERRLFEKIGPPALKLHTGRSRNDQVALDVRLYLKAETGSIIREMIGLARAVTKFAEVHLDTILPGYTHLQRAQPVVFAHHLMAYVEMFRRDIARFQDARKRMDVMPLGAAALAGTPHGIDRFRAAERLGFSAVSRNSIDAVSDRDFIIEFLSAAGIAMIHFSRLAEELILWSSAEFGFIALPDDFATGSSIMPQKKNPDVPELIRGRTGRVVGDLTTLFLLMKSLPLAYNRDMQEDKAPLFSTVDILKSVIPVLTALIPRLEVDPAAMRRAAAAGCLEATDLADYLAAKGMPFREAHAVVGKAVAYAIENGMELSEMSLETLQRFSAVIEADVFEILSLEAMVDRRNNYGGGARSRVKSALSEAAAALDTLLRDTPPPVNPVFSE
jgi:argininosuccinate lyase